MIDIDFILTMFQQYKLNNIKYIFESSVVALPSEITSGQPRDIILDSR